jgi:hypothetical protein
LSEATGGPPMMLENVIPMMVVTAVIFGVLWLIVEAAT